MTIGGWNFDVLLAFTKCVCIVVHLVGVFELLYIQVYRAEDVFLPVCQCFNAVTDRVDIT